MDRFNHVFLGADYIVLFATLGLEIVGTAGGSTSFYKDERFPHLLFSPSAGAAEDLPGTLLLFGTLYRPYIPTTTPDIYIRSMYQGTTALNSGANSNSPTRACKFTAALNTLMYFKVRGTTEVTVLGLTLCGTYVVSATAWFGETVR